MIPGIQLQLTAAMLKRPTIHVTCWGTAWRTFPPVGSRINLMHLTDIQMPAMRRLRPIGCHPCTSGCPGKTIPVIAITARSDMDAEYFVPRGFGRMSPQTFNTHEIFEGSSQAIRQDLTDLEETGTEIPWAPTNDSSHTDSSGIWTSSALTAFSEDDPNAAKEIIRTFVSKQKRTGTAWPPLKMEIEGITAMAHKLLPLFTMLGANTSIAPLTWLEQKTGNNRNDLRNTRKVLFILRK